MPSRYEALLEHTHDAVAVLDQDGTIVEANRRWAELGDDDLPLLRRLAAQGGGATPGPVPVRGRDGTTRMVELTVSPVEEDTRTLALAVGHDVTARVAAELALHETERRFHALLERLPDVVWSASVDGDVLFMSSNVERVSGMTAAELSVGGISKWLAAIHPEDAGTAQAAFDDLVAGRIESFDLEYRFHRPDGRWIWLRSRTSARYLVDGVVHADGLISDVTERRRLEENLCQAQKMEAIGLLAGGIAHDFNNHLAVITADCGSLAMELAPGDPRREEVREIEDAAFRAAALIRQLLVFSRSRRVQPEELAIDAVVSDLARMLRRVIGEDVALTLRLPDAPRLRVMMDRSELEQVILNLAVNARDAMPRGGSLAISVAEADGQVRIAVTDTGEGMSADVRARIFEPFFTTKSVGRGTGLGLSTVYAIVDHAGGTITVDSEPGLGATFVLRLPAIQGIRAARRKTAPPPLRGTERVLLVEDDPAVRSATARILRSSGYDVVEAADAASALAIVRADDRLALVISDVVMPGRSGPELIGDLREVRPALPWLLVSGYSEHNALPDDLLADTSRFLPKPFLPDDLRRRVRTLLDAAAAAA